MKYIKNILTQWKLECGATIPIQFKYDDCNGILTIFTSQPGWMIGKAGSHVYKYMDIFKSGLHGFKNIEIIEVEGYIVG